MQNETMLIISFTKMHSFDKQNGGFALTFKMGYNNNHSPQHFIIEGYAGILNQMVHIYIVRADNINAHI